MPPGEVTVTALFLDFGYIWAGLSNGRVAVFSTETYQIVRTLELFDAKKDKKIVSIIQADDTGSPQGEAPSCSRRSAVCVVAETGVVVVVDKLFYRPRRKVLLFPVGVERKVTSVRVAPCRVWVSSVSLEPQCPASTISVVDTNTLRLISTIPVPDEYVCEIAPVVGDTTDSSSSSNNNNNNNDDDDDDDSNSGDNSSSSSDGGGGASASHKPHTDLFAWCVTKSRKLVLVSSGSSGDDSVISEVLCSSPTLQGKKLSNLFVSEGRVWYLSGGRVCVVPAGGPAHEHEPKVLYPIPGSDDGRLACLAPVRIPWNAGGDMTEFFVGIGLDGMTRLWNAKDLGAEAVLKDGVTGLKVPKLLATFYDMQSGSALWVTSDKESKSLHIFALKKDEFLNSKV